MNVNNFYLKVKRVIKEKRLFITLYQIIRDKTIRKILPYFRNKQMHENLNKFYSIKINNKDLKLIYTNQKTLSRNKTILTKEKQTINWIDSFHPNHILLDIGANIGIFSIYAATKNIKVFSVEPMARNFNILTQNIIINQLYKYITPLNIGINDTTRINRFEIAYNIDGQSGHQILPEDSLSNNQYINILTYQLDDLVMEIMKIDPNHIKIDTDGNELKILKSGINLFNSNNLFSISIEIDESNQDECDEIINFLSSYKFEISSKETTGSSNKYLYNYIFKRST